MKKLVALGVVLLVAGPAMAGTWAEIPDAPAGPISGQVTDGTGQLDLITGSTSPGDSTDAFWIHITNVDNFYATTDPTYDGRLPSQWDTRLWLFKPDGTPVMGNDDSPNFSPGYMSLLTNPADWPGELGADPPAPLTVGEYLLVFGGYGTDPGDGSGTSLIDLATDFEALHGPNPSAGSFVSWMGNPETGEYQIGLGGVEFSVPEPGTLSLLCLGALALIRRHR